MSDEQVILLPPIPVSCFAPIISIDRFDDQTGVFLPSTSECRPWQDYTVSKKYSTDGVCPSNYHYDDGWLDPTERVGPRAMRMCCPM